MHGPRLLVPGRRDAGKTYLYALLDDASRVLSGIRPCPRRCNIVTCALCGAKTTCRMEIADRMLPLCPECMPVLATEGEAGGEAGALARAFLAAADIPTIH